MTDTPQILGDKVRTLEDEFFRKEDQRLTARLKEIREKDVSRDALAKASGIKPVRLVNHVLQFYFTFRQEKVHPLQGGFFRRKLRRQRRSGLPRENPLMFYPRRLWEIADTHVRLAAFYWFLHRIRKKVERDKLPYSDPALLPIEPQVPAIPVAPKMESAAA